MLDGTRFVVSAPKHKRKHSPTRLPDLLDTAHAGSRSAVPLETFVSGNYSRCPPPAAWRLSHWVAECAGVRTHSDRRYLSRCSKTGAARHQVHQYIGVTLSSFCVTKLTCVSASEYPFCSDVAFGRESLLHRSALPVRFWRLTSAGRWVRRRELNPQPLAYETGKLPLLYSAWRDVLGSNQRRSD